MHSTMRVVTIAMSSSTMQSETIICSTTNV